MARPYYNLLERTDGVWYPQFGDYSRKVVSDERRDILDGHDAPLAKDLMIVKLPNDQQAALDAKLMELNVPHFAHIFAWWMNNNL